MIQKPTPQSQEYSRLTHQYSFIDINDSNIENYLSVVRSYMDRYPQAKYAYNLWKKLILGVSYSIKNGVNIDFIKIDNVDKAFFDIDGFIDFFDKDWIEEKERVTKAIKNILSALRDQVISKLKDITGQEQNNISLKIALGKTLFQCAQRINEYNNNKQLEEQQMPSSFAPSMH